MLVKKRLKLEPLCSYVGLMFFSQLMWHLLVFRQVSHWSLSLDRALVDHSFAGVWQVHR